MHHKNVFIFLSTNMASSEKYFHFVRPLLKHTSVSHSYSYKIIRETNTKREKSDTFLDI